jgi:hypothetical protein
MMLAMEMDSAASPVTGAHLCGLVLVVGFLVLRGLIPSAANRQLGIHRFAISSSYSPLLHSPFRHADRGD